MKRKIFCVLCLLFVIVTFTKAQTNSANSLTLNEQMEFHIDVTSIDQMDTTYQVDISKLNFTSPENLETFCKSFSWDFHTLKGNFNTKEITVTLNKIALAENNYDVNKLNNYFKSVSRRMQYIYNTQKK